MAKASGGKETKRGSGMQAPEIKLPVFYNKGGRQVKANGTRFSAKGCVIYTRNPHDCGTSFSLKITNPHSNKSIQVDSSVILRKRFADNKNWGMVVRFMNLTEGARDEIDQVLSQATAIPESASDSKYLKTPIGQAILRYFNLKKLIG
ncbi:MAG: PilZ domain-containing protein [Deltaproteobacteria bacterium]|jgi:hypothetical protein|nr:MAG: PilZ domain-containing protein [Deltaproteobacteria bacterium]